MREEKAFEKLLSPSASSVAEPSVSLEVASPSPEVASPESPAVDEFDEFVEASVPLGDLGDLGFVGLGLGFLMSRRT